MMINDLPFVSLLIFLPLVGCLFIFMIRGNEEAQAANAKAVALLASLATLAVAVLVALQLDLNSPEFQLQEKVPWIKSFNISYHVGIDGISMLFIILTAVLMPIALLSSSQSVQFRVKEYMMVFLVLETMLLGMFCALDFIVFYFFSQPLYSNPRKSAIAKIVNTTNATA